VLANVVTAATLRYSRQCLHSWARITIYFYVFLGYDNKLPTNTTRTAVYVAATAKISWLDALENTARAKAKDRTKREVVIRDHVLEVTKIRTIIGTRSMTSPMTAITMRAKRSTEGEMWRVWSRCACRTFTDPAIYQLGDTSVNTGFDRGAGISLTYQSYFQISVSCPVLSDLSQKHPETSQEEISGVLLPANRPFLRRQRSARGPSDSRSLVSPSNAVREKSWLGAHLYCDCEGCPVACMC
jgi:hypothetical protein